MLLTGCHRSGTSLLAAIVSQCVQEERDNDLTPLVDNPTGYFESHVLRDCNDLILERAGYSWHCPPLHPLAWHGGERLRSLVEQRPKFRHWSTTSDWVDKDPRLCITFGAYKHILLERPPLAISLRTPQEVAQSLFKRDGISQSKGLLIWFLYNRGISIQLEPGDPVVLYEELLNWSNTSSKADKALTTIWEWLQTNLNDTSALGSAPEKLLQKSRKLIQPALQRSEQATARECRLSAKLLDLCQSIYRRVECSPIEERHLVMRQSFDEIPGWLVNAYEEVAFSGHPDLEYLRSKPQDRSEVLRAELAALRDSTSWKVTSPIRWIGDLFKR